MDKIKDNITHKRIARARCYSTKPERKLDRVWDDELGSQEQQDECADAFENVVIKILNYADRKELLTEEEESEIRRFYAYFIGGIKKRNLRYKSRDVPLTSADVLYILSREHKDSYRILGNRFGVSYETIRMIMTGKYHLYKFEHDLYKRLKNIVRNEIKDNIDKYSINIYLLYEVTTCSNGDHKELLCISKSRRYLEELRFKIIKKKYDTPHYKKMLKNGTLNALYPLEKSDISKDYFYLYDRQ